MIVTAIILAASLPNAMAQSSGDDILQKDERLYDLVSAPSNIPLLADFHERSVNNPGGSGEIAFRVTNRYWESDLNRNSILDENEDLNGNNIKDGITLYGMELKVEIFRYMTLRVSRDIDDDFFHPPTFNGDALAVVPIGTMDWNETINVSLKIDAHDDTPQGTYLVRTMLQYRFGNSSGAHVVLRSRGYFSDDSWEAYERSKDFNISLLDTQPVHGIIPETSFHVTKESPLYTICFAGLVVLSIGLLFSAWLFHQMDEYGRYPQLNKRIHNIWRRTPLNRKKDQRDDWEDYQRLKREEL